MTEEWETSFRIPASREEMVQNQLEARGILDPLVLEVFKRVPREEFVPEKYKSMAFADQPLPIGHNQTISQPYVVAFMTEILEITSDERVLEIGTGCGYQTAILSQLAKEVFSVEVIEQLAERARRCLNRLGYNNVHIKVGDGNLGWKSRAPFQAILVSAAAKEVPRELIRQLDLSGRMIIPIGKSVWSQDLIFIRKDKDGNISKKSVLPVRFVPLVEKKRSEKSRRKG